MSFPNVAFFHFCFHFPFDRCFHKTCSVRGEMAGNNCRREKQKKNTQLTRRRLRAYNGGATAPAQASFTPSLTYAKGVARACARARAIALACVNGEELKMRFPRATPPPRSRARVCAEKCVNCRHRRPAAFLFTTTFYSVQGVEKAFFYYLNLPSSRVAVAFFALFNDKKLDRK